jgi:hypothetical protein
MGFSTFAISRHHVLGTMAEASCGFGRPGYTLAADYRISAERAGTLYPFMATHEPRNRSFLGSIISLGLFGRGRSG